MHDAFIVFFALIATAVTEATRTSPLGMGCFMKSRVSSKSPRGSELQQSAVLPGNSLHEAIQYCNSVSARFALLSPEGFNSTRVVCAGAVLVDEHVPIETLLYHDYQRIRDKEDWDQKRLADMMFADCTFACPGSPGDACGGENRYAVYKLLQYVPGYDQPGLSRKSTGSYCPMPLQVRGWEGNINVGCFEGGSSAEGRLQVLDPDHVGLQAKQLLSACAAACDLKWLTCDLAFGINCHGKHMLCLQGAFLTLQEGMYVPRHFCESPEESTRRRLFLPYIQRITADFGWTEEEIMAFIESLGAGKREAATLNSAIDVSFLDKAMRLIDYEGLSGRQGLVAKAGAILGIVAETWEKFGVFQTRRIALSSDEWMNAMNDILEPKRIYTDHD